MAKPQPVITEDNFLKLVINWTLLVQQDDFWKHWKECPYDTNLEDESHAVDRACIWYTMERINPQTNVTPLEKFIDTFVSDQDLAAKFLQTKNPIYDEFDIIRMETDNRVTAVASSTGKAYVVRMGGKISRIFPTMIFEGYICPWESDGTYRSIGIIRFRYPYQSTKFLKSLLSLRKLIDKDVNKIASVYITPNITISAYLNKQAVILSKIMGQALGIELPRKAERIKAISAALRNDANLYAGISAVEAKCLANILCAPKGFVRYGILKKKFGDDDFKIRNTKEIKTTIGKLRLKGLILAGKIMINGRAYKAVVVPAEVRRSGPAQKLIRARQQA